MPNKSSNNNADAEEVLCWGLAGLLFCWIFCLGIRGDEMRSNCCHPCLIFIFALGCGVTAGTFSGISLITTKIGNVGGIILGILIGMISTCLVSIVINVIDINCRCSTCCDDYECQCPCRRRSSSSQV